MWVWRTQLIFPSSWIPRFDFRQIQICGICDGRKYIEKIEEGKVDDDCVAQHLAQKNYSFLNMLNKHV